MVEGARVHAFADDALGTHDATAVAELVRSGTLSATEVVDAAVARARKLDPQIAAVAAPDFDRARQVARAGLTGAFGGVPTFVKDNVDVAGLPTCQGSRAVRPVPARADGPFARQLLSEGLVVLGKSRMPEFGLNATTEYEEQPPARNPWDTDYSTGASSGGSAALVASGVVPLAHGNDGGGSIRIPAACCGVVGLKPTRGRFLGEPPLPVKTVGQGVLSRTVRDTARFCAAAESYHRNHRLPPIGHVAAASPRRLRVGLVVDSITDTPTDADTRAAITATADLLESLGHHVEEMRLPIDQRFIDDFTVYWGLLAYLLTRFGGRALGPDFDPSRVDSLTRGLVSMYRSRISRTLALVYRLRRTSRDYARMFKTHDVVMSPVLAHTTPRLGYLSPALDLRTVLDRLVHYVSFTPLNNTAGGPAISVPSGRSSSGLPIGAHFSARHGDERTLLELAYELELAAPWPRVDTYIPRRTQS